MNQVNATNASQASLGVTICAAALIASFFMPWVSAFGFNASGFDITKLGSYANWLWIIPASAGLTLLVSLTNSDNRLVGFITGAIPLAALVYVFARAGQAEMPGFLRDVVTEGLTKVAGIGLWLTIACSVVIVLAALLGLQNSSVPNVANSMPRHDTEAPLMKAVEPSYVNEVSPAHHAATVGNKIASAFCPECGSKVSSNSSFCGECGQAL